MVQKIKTEDGSLEVMLHDDGTIEIESPHFERVGVEISRVDPTLPSVMDGDALFKIQTYIPEEGAKTIPFEYGMAFVRKDGEILSRAPSYLEKNR